MRIAGDVFYRPVVGVAVALAHSGFSHVMRGNEERK